MDFQTRKQEAYRKLLSDFVPDLTRSKEPGIVLQVLELTRQGMYTHEIGPLLGKTPKAIQKLFRRYNFPVLHNLCRPIGVDNPSWKHGEKWMKGYRYLRTPGHPNGIGKGNYVAHHRLVMEETLGRYLLPTEVVDHIDGSKTNNHPSNLRLFESNGAHLAHTRAGKCPNWTPEGRSRLRARVESQRVGAKYLKIGPSKVSTHF